MIIILSSPEKGHGHQTQPHIIQSKHVYIALSGQQQNWLPIDEMVKC